MKFVEIVMGAIVFVNTGRVDGRKAFDGACGLRERDDALGVPAVAAAAADGVQVRYVIAV